MGVKNEQCRICFQRAIHGMQRVLMPCHVVQMVGGCRSRTANLRLETAPSVEAVPAWSKSAPETPGANRAADCLPLCGFAPGLLAHVQHRVGMGSGLGEG